MRIFTLAIFLLFNLALSAQGQVDLPITFEDTASVDYAIADFGGNASMLIVDPEDPSNLVVQSIKTETSELWAGTTYGEFGLANPIPFTMEATTMTVRVWSPDAGIPIRLKVEDKTDPTKSVETEATITIAGAWNTLTFDFSNEAVGTAELNLTYTFDKASIFFNFGVTGMDAGEKTYYADDVMFGEGGGGLKDQVDLPITFEDSASVDYALVDFGGNASMIMMDPEDQNNLVLQAVKTDAAEVWAGTTIGNNGLFTPIPFAMGATSMTVRVWSPDANIPIRLKVENVNDAGISVETEAMTVSAGAWDTLTFDFSNESENTAALNLANTYDKVSVFFNFGTSGMDAGEKTYYADDIYFVEGGGVLKDQVNLPITLEDTASVDYALADFGGNASMIVVDPVDEDNLVVQAIKTGAAEVWAGTTFGEFGIIDAIPFTIDDTKMTVRVWSPDANIPIRLKVEDKTDPTKSVETEAFITDPGVWNTLTFDFANEAEGTAALNLDFTFNKVSLFFNFGTSGMDAGEKTYYADDIYFGDINVATENESNDLFWTIFPNPASDMITVSSSNQENAIKSVEFYNSVGTLESSVLNIENNGTISLERFATGTYYVRISSELSTEVQKLIITK